jgi:hypothetical protein
MVGGMVSSTILTLIVIPAVYSLWQEARLRRAVEADRPEGAVVGQTPEPAAAIT